MQGKSRYCNFETWMLNGCPIARCQNLVASTWTSYAGMLTTAMWLHQPLADVVWMLLKLLQACNAWKLLPISGSSHPKISITCLCCNGIRPGNASGGLGNSLGHAEQQVGGVPVATARQRKHLLRRLQKDLLVVKLQPQQRRGEQGHTDHADVVTAFGNQSMA